MADPLRLAGCPAGILSLGLQVGQGLLQYYDSWKGQETKVARLCSSLTGLTSTLQVLQNELAGNGPTGMAENVMGRILDCRDGIQELGEALDKVKAQPSRGVRGKLREHGSKLLYPFRESTLLAMHEAMIGVRLNLDLALQILNLSTVRDMTKYLPAWEEMLSHHENEQTRSILSWFSDIHSQETQRQFRSSRQEGTGMYLLKSDEFKDWLDGTQRILWCVGPPGTGKTILCSAVVDTLYATFEPSTVGIAFLYCAYADRKSQTVEQLLGSLVQQLLLLHPTTPEDARKLYLSCKQNSQQPDAALLFKQLESTASLFPKVYVVVDALDECNEDNDTRASLLARLLSLDSRVQLLFTSRQIGKVDGLRGAIQFSVRAQNEDMRKFLATQIEQNRWFGDLCARHEGLEEEVIGRIIAKADGMFLMAKLHLQTITSQLRLGTVRKAVEALPEKLEDIYNNTMERIRNGQDKERAKVAMRMLWLLTYALRPLKLGEIQHALLTLEAEPDDTGIDSEDVYDENLLISVAAGVVVLEDETFVLRFVHYTAQAHMWTNREKLFSATAIDFAALCVRYLSFDEFSNGPCPSKAQFEERLRSNAFYSYAANNWGVHTRGSTPGRWVQEFCAHQAKVDASVQALAKVRRWMPHRRCIEYSQPFPFARRMTGLHLAACFGAEETATLLIDANNPNTKDSWGLTPLNWAVFYPNLHIVKLLVENGADTESRGLYGSTPMFDAAGRRQAAIVRTLLDHGADADATDCTGHTSLIHACRMGHADVIQLLLDKGADAGAMDWRRRTALMHAIMYGRKAIVRVFLSQDTVDLTLADNNGRTALFYAILEGSTCTFKLLLSRTVNPDAADHSGLTPLAVAVQNGRHAIMELLLAANDTDLASRDHCGRTPWWWAHNKGDSRAIELLAQSASVRGVSLSNGTTPFYIPPAICAQDQPPSRSLTTNAASATCEIQDVRQM